jgi:hypothetical protein
MDSHLTSSEVAYELGRGERVNRDGGCVSQSFLRDDFFKKIIQKII